MSCGALYNESMELGCCWTSSVLGVQLAVALQGAEAFLGNVQIQNACNGIATMTTCIVIAEALAFVFISSAGYDCAPWVHCCMFGRVSCFNKAEVN